MRGSLDELSLQAAAGLVYLTGVLQQGAAGQPRQVLFGISAADGRVKWQFAPSPPETLMKYAPGMMSVTSSSGSTWQDELDPATGRVRWEVASAYDAIATPAGIVIAPGPDGTDQISVHDTLTGQTRWTARLARMNLGWPQHAPALPVFPAGPLLLVPAAAYRARTDHHLPHLRWPARMAGHDPGAGSSPAVGRAGGMLISSADLQLPL